MRPLGALAAAGLTLSCLAAACAPVDAGQGALPYQPTFSGRVTKGGAPAAGRQLSLHAFTGRLESLYEHRLPAVVAEAVTDEDGRYSLKVPLEGVLADTLYGVAYDAAASQPSRRSQDTNPDEIRAFDTPAIWLHGKQGLKAEVSFDLAWDTQGFVPRFGDTVASSTVAFQLAPHAGANDYDLTVVQGSLQAQGDEVFMRQLKAPNLAIAWQQAPVGPQVWQARAYLSPTGIPNVASFRVAAPALTLTVGRPAAKLSHLPTTPPRKGVPS